MTLSPIERHLLINQYEILKRLDPDQVNRCNELLSLLNSGFDTDFEELLTQYDNPPLSDDVRREVRDIIHMFQLLGPRNASPAANFSGFSRDDETEHYDYAMFVLEGDADIIPAAAFNCNTPFPTLPAYRAMLKEWRASSDPENLTANDVQRINAHASIGFPSEETD